MVMFTWLLSYQNGIGLNLTYIFVTYFATMISCSSSCRDSSLK